MLQFDLRIFFGWVETGNPQLEKQKTQSLRIHNRRACGCCGSVCVAGGPFQRSKSCPPRRRPEQGGDRGKEMMDIFSGDIVGCSPISTWDPYGEILRERQLNTIGSLLGGFPQLFPLIIRRCRGRSDSIFEEADISITCFFFPGEFLDF